MALGRIVAGMIAIILAGYVVVDGAQAYRDAPRWMAVMDICAGGAVVVASIAALVRPRWFSSPGLRWLMMIAAVLNIASVTRRPFELSAYELGRDAAILAMPLVALSLLWRERRA